MSAKENRLLFNKAILDLAEFYNEEDSDFALFLSHVDGLVCRFLPFLIEAVGDENRSLLLLNKISNLLVAKYQYLCRHEYLLAKPFGLVVDPSNACPLRCPGCIHNDYLRQHDEVDWPFGLLSEKTFSRLIDFYGPFALYMHFFNWGEPLMNKNTPKFIDVAKRHMLNTVLSSNLSIIFDVDALVLSGLDYLIMSIDGATPETYNKYRKGGDFDLVLSNVKKLVQAKEVHGMETPYLTWQFLTFQHNQDDIVLARQLAEDIGINEIHFGEPYDVSWGDPSIQVAKGYVDRISFPVANRKNSTNPENAVLSFRNLTRRPVCRWVEEYEDAARRGVTFRRRKGEPCQWLYKNLVMDALGRVIPCCSAPKKDDGYKYVFSTVDESFEGEPYNSDCYRYVRMIIDGEDNVSMYDDLYPFCLLCDGSVRYNPNITNEMGIEYFNKYVVSGLLLQSTIDFIFDWNQ